MTGLARRWVGAALSGTVLLREASRTARRWQTYATRAAFSGVLMGLVLVGIWIATEAPAFFEMVDAANLGWLGRGMFDAFAVVQTLLGFVFAPLLVSRAIIEEREDQTIELLLLTNLTARQVLVGKFASRVVLLISVILGALPVMALVVSLGGVGIVEVVAVTVHTIVAVIVLGSLGAFFALFTRSALIATGAALFYTLPTFIVMPLIYGLMIADWHGLAHLSPVFGSWAETWAALLPGLAFAPVVWLVFQIGAPLFALRIASARMGRLFDGRIWRAPSLMWIGLALGIHTLSGLPLGVVGAWYFRFSSAPSTWSTMVMNVGSIGLVWIWFVGCIYLGTWVYLRVTMDMVLVLDQYLHLGGRRAHGRRPEPRVRGNPVLWREARPRAWRLVFPGLIGWAVVLIVIFQTGLWVIPGGLLMLGAVNAGTALLLAMWLATASIERERHDGTLEVLLTTTLSSLRIVAGKLAGVAIPSSGLLIVSFPMILLGMPYLQLWMKVPPLESVIRAAGVCLWLIPAWVLVMVVAMAVALKLRKSRNAYAVNMALGVIFVVAPPLAATLFPSFAPIRVPARFLVPALSASATPLELAGSMAGMSALALGVFVLMVVRLRAWGMDDR